MNSKFNFLALFLLGLVLINVEFIMYTYVDFFSVISLVIMFPMILLAIIAMNYYDERTEWKVYVLTVALMIIYGIYANIYEVFIVVAGVIFVWFYRTYLMYLRKTDLLVGVFISYLGLFSALTMYFVFAYNLNLNIAMVFLVNTLIGSTVNALLCYIAILIFTSDYEKVDR